MKKTSNHFPPPHVAGLVRDKAVRISQQRDNITAVNPADDTLKSMNSRINHLVNEHKRTKYLEHLECCSLSLKKLCRIIKNLSGFKTDKNLSAIEFGDRQHIERKKCAKEFCKQFVEHPTMQKREKIATLGTLRNLSRDRQELPFKQSEANGPD